MKGMKALEYRIWQRSYLKMQNETDRYIYLFKILNQMRSIRSIRLNKNFSIASIRNKN